MRLDRFLAKTLGHTRTEVKKLIRNGQIKINGTVIKTDGFQVQTAVDIVTFGDKVLEYEEYQYYIINKPMGYVCANEDNLHPTIIDYTPDFIANKVHTVGRLDKDTTGALMLTNDGKLTHQLISPKSEVPKVYLATLDGKVTADLITPFAVGFTINDEIETLPATLEIINDYTARVSVIEGKYHQIKRMFAAFGLKVIALHRERFGPLDVFDLQIGEYRKLTKNEVKLLIKD